MNADFQPAGERGARNRKKTPDGVVENLAVENGLLREQVGQLLGRISMLESTLLQRQEEIEQTRRELDGQKRELVAHDAVVEGIQSKLDEANAWVFKLAGERRSAELELRRANAQRDRIERENTTLLSARKAAVEAALRLKEQLEREAQEKADILEELDEYRLDHTALENAQADLRREIDRLQVAHRTATAALGDRDARIEGLGSEIRKQGEEMRVQHDLIHWLQLVATEIRRSRRWWFLLSQQRRNRLLARRLFRIGLFDTQSYLDHNPDVLEAGMDPLVHYLVHGVREGRQR